MRKALACGLLPLLAAGCFTLPSSMDQKKPQAPLAAAVPCPPNPAPPVKPVLAGQVNETNAHDMAEALRREMDQDEESAALGTAGR